MSLDLSNLKKAIESLKQSIQYASNLPKGFDKDIGSARLIRIRSIKSTLHPFRSLKQWL